MSLWVYVDLDSMMPKRLGDGFLERYGEAAGGRTVGSKLVLPGPAAAAAAEADAEADDDDDADAEADDDDAALERRPWPLRRTDIDVLGHVNNAAYWSAVEELLGDRPELLAGPHRGVVEFAKAIGPDAPVELLVRHASSSFSAWMVVDGVVHASLLVIGEESPRNL